MGTGNCIIVEGGADPNIFRMDLFLQIGCRRSVRDPQLMLKDGYGGDGRGFRAQDRWPQTQDFKSGLFRLRDLPIIPASLGPHAQDDSIRGRDCIGLPWLLRFFAEQHFCAICELRASQKIVE